MSYLNDQFVLSKVFPKRNIIIEVILCEEPMISNFRESVYSMSSLGTCCEKSSQQNEWEKTMCQPHHNLSICIMICHIFKCDHSLLGPSKKVETKPNSDSVNDVGIVSMKSEPVGTNTWCLIKFLGLLFVNKATFNHPPSYDSLKSSEEKQEHQ